MHNVMWSTSDSTSGMLRDVLIVPLTKAQTPSREEWADRQTERYRRTASTYLASRPLLSLMPALCLELFWKNPSVLHYQERLMPPHWWLPQSLGLFHVSTGKQKQRFKACRSVKSRIVQMFLSLTFWSNHCFNCSITNGWKSENSTGYYSSLFSQHHRKHVIPARLRSLSVILLCQGLLRDESPTKATV